MEGGIWPTQKCGAHGYWLEENVLLFTVMMMMMMISLAKTADACKVVVRA